LFAGEHAIISLLLKVMPGKVRILEGLSRASGIPKKNILP